LGANNNIPAVSPDHFSACISDVITTMYNALSGLIVPLVMFMMLVSIILFIIGSALRLKSLRQMGGGGFIGAAAGFLVYMALPAILGFVKTLSIFLR